VHPKDEDLYHYLSRIGFTAKQLQYTRRSFVNATGDGIHHISAATALEDMQDDTFGTQDWRIMDGYDTIVQHLALGLDIRLETIITAVNWHGDTIKVTALNGETFEGERVIVALPAGVINAGSVKFDPPLPAAKVNAMLDLNMGPGLKIIYVFDEPILPEGVGALYSKHNPPMWWSPTFGQENAQKFAITGFATGNWARELFQFGNDAIIAKGLGTLREELNTNIPDPVHVHIQNWSDDPFAKGVYSVVSPGAINCRAIAAKPVEQKLFWAGEAVAPNAFAATVHGAYLSGERAAKEVLGSF
jgi:monoamine oxidase